MPLSLHELPADVLNVCECNPRHWRWVRQPARCAHCHGWLYPARAVLPEAAEAIAQLRLVGVLQAYDTPQYAAMPIGYRENPISLCRYSRKYRSKRLRLGIEVEFTARSQHEVPARYAFTQAYAQLESNYLSLRRREADAYCVLKHDGSIRGGVGAEFACIPAEIADHAACWNIPDWRSLTANSSCGLHIHIDRRDISRLTVGKFHCFWNNVAVVESCQHLMGRGPTDYCQARELVASGLPNQRAAGRGRYGSTRERYSVVNHRRRTTVELRLPQAPANLLQLTARLQAVEASVKFLKLYSVADLLGGRSRERIWEDFMRWCADQPGKPYQVVTEHAHL